MSVSWSQNRLARRVKEPTFEGYTVHSTVAVLPGKTSFLQIRREITG